MNILDFRKLRNLNCLISRYNTCILLKIWYIIEEYISYIIVHYRYNVNFI